MRGLLRAALLAIPALGFSAPAQADDAWPDHQVKFIVPSAAGAGLDAAARLVADALAKRLGQPFVIDNFAGIPVVGTAAGAKAAPDGYTIVTATGDPIAIAPSLRPNLPYNPATDLAPVGLINESVSVLVVNPKLIPAKTLPELLALMKANPGKYDFGSNGIGGESHLYMERLMLANGIEAHHIPYKDGGEQLTAILGGEVGIEFMNSKTVLPHVLSGEVRALAVVSANRLKDLPEVPSVHELVPAFGAFSTWQGLFVPARTPPPIIAKLSAALADYVSSPQAAIDMRKIGAEPRVATPAQFADLIRNDTATWAEVIKAAHITLQ